MSQLIVARHGQDTDNEKGLLNGHRNTFLTSLGEQQASRLASEMRKKQVQFIYSSPLIRAKKTAMVVAELLDLPLHILDDLIERDFGEFTGRKLSDISEMADEVLETKNINYFLNGPGVELFEQVLERAKRVLELIKKNNPYERVLIVCHGDIMKMIVAVHTNKHWKKVLVEGWYENCGFIEL